MVSLNAEAHDLRLVADANVSFQQNASATDPLLPMPVPGTSRHGRKTPDFAPIRTEWTVVIEVLLLVGLVVLAFYRPFKLGLEDIDGKRPLPLLASAHVFVWLCFLGLTGFQSWRHRRSRVHGYLAFYKQTRNMRRVPAILLAFGNAAILIYAAFWPLQKDTLCAQTFLEVLLSIETAIALPCQVVYLAWVISFNRRRNAPDVKEMNRYGTSTASSPASVRRVMEEQADLINFYQQHSRKLRREIETLREERAGHSWKSLT